MTWLSTVGIESIRVAIVCGWRFLQRAWGGGTAPLMDFSNPHTAIEACAPALPPRARERWNHHASWFHRPSIDAPEGGAYADRFDACGFASSFLFGCPLPVVSNFRKLPLI